MQGLTADEVLKWGKAALNTLGCVSKIDADRIPVDLDWMINAKYWALGVLDEVEAVIGTEDSVLLDYAATVCGDPLTQRVDWAKEGF
jgi:hypothetical protein